MFLSMRTPSRMESTMLWAEIFLSLVRCELKAKYSHIKGWQISAKGALPVILCILAFVAWFTRNAG